jgi:hypothetical protein
LECGNNAHIDALGVLLLVGALGVLAAGDSPGSRRVAAAGGLFGAAVAVKLLPALAAPGLLARRAHVLLGAAAAVFAVGYLPHVVAVGTRVIGYLPGYLHEEGYSGTERFGALRLLVGDSAAPTVAVLMVAAVAGVVWWQARHRPAAHGALLVSGAAFLLIGPSQPWYGLLLVALVVLAGRPEWLAVSAAAYPVYQAGTVGVDNTVMQQRTYLPAAALIMVVAAGRWAVNARRAGSRRPR